MQAVHESRHVYVEGIRDKSDRLFDEEGQVFLGGSQEVDAGGMGQSAKER